MSHAKLLDCTLRDGAYLIDKSFGDAVIKGIINGLVEAHIDYIEIGFFQDEGYGDGKTVYKNSQQAKKFVPNEKRGCQFTVLADYSRYSIENLDDRVEDSVDAVRECFFKHERYAALDVCKIIKQKGYKLFIQPVDILGYTDKEIVDFIEEVNKIEPYCFSIVDTFGSMYLEDLHRIFEIINHNLISTCKIGFHSHNNMQLSSALSQEFLRMTINKREVIIDGTISGMGRGAGNTPTELITQYMVSKMGYTYDLDAILDIIDDYMDGIKARCTWGYNTPYFIAGSYGAHVNNISYLTKKNSIRSKDVRFILNRIGVENRKRYNYDLLERTYLDYLNSDIDDTRVIKQLISEFHGKNVLLIAPGNSINNNRKKIGDYILEKNAIVITINFLHEEIKSDYVYISNTRRYKYWSNYETFNKHKKIITSNIMPCSNDNQNLIVSFIRLIKCGWEHMDNSTIMLLRLMDIVNPDTIAIAGFDGYEYYRGNNDGKMNYMSKEMEISNVWTNPSKINEEISAMIKDYTSTRKNIIPLKFITKSRFSKDLEGQEN